MQTETIRTPPTEQASLIDRRSLSQAWYSALHYVERTTTPVRHAASATPDPREAALAANSRYAPVRRRATRPAVAAPRSLERRAASAPPGSPARSGIARRVEALALARAFAPNASAGVTVTFGKARIHVLARRSHDGVRVVALCPAELEDAVVRALAHAAAGQGALVRCEVIGIGAQP